MDLDHAVLSHGEMAYQVQGDPRNKAVILLHGFLGSHLYWEKVIPELSSSYYVIVPDLRGHGRTFVSESGYGMEDMANDVVELMDKVGIQKAAIFGHSMGGYTALAIAEQHPERVSALSLVHSAPQPDSEEGKKGREANQRRIRKEGVKFVTDTLIPKLFAQSQHSQLEHEMDAARHIGYETPAEGAVGALEAMKNRKDRTVVLKQASFPVLLLAGEEDAVISSENAFAVNGENIRHVLLKGVGHMGMYEAPQELASSIKQFLE